MGFHHVKVMTAKRNGQQIKTLELVWELGGAGENCKNFLKKKKIACLPTVPLTIIITLLRFSKGLPSHVLTFLPKRNMCGPCPTCDARDALKTGHSPSSVSTGRYRPNFLEFKLEPNYVEPIILPSKKGWAQLRQVLSPSKLLQKQSLLIRF